MREVLFVRQAGDLALATSHLAQSSFASRGTAARAGFLLLSQSGERGRGLESESVPISGPLYLNLGRLLRTSRNSLGPLRSRRLRRCRSCLAADGSLRRSISWPAIARAFAALSVRTPARWALGPCSVAMIESHSSQTMSAASCSSLSFAFITSNIIGCVLLQVGHAIDGGRRQTLGKPAEATWRKCEFDQMRKVPLVGKAGALALTTGHSYLDRPATMK